MNIIKATFIVLLTAFATFAFTYVVIDIKPDIGDPAPEIALPGVDGKIKRLSELEGKLVLIDFWASWCRTCRVENVSYTAAYDKYKNKQFKSGNGFEIYSVSLDRDAEMWKQAIKNDGLDWKYHVTDLKKWKSPVVMSYNFKYLPHNVLVDKDGKVIAKGLFGERLDKFLAGQVAN